MLRSFLEGVILLGLPMVFMFGPAFFALLQTSVQRSFKSGIFLAFGIFLSDTTLVALSYFGILELLSAPSNQLIVGIIGGIILLAFGVYTFSRKVHIDEKGNIYDNAIGVKTFGPAAYMLKGFFLNIANPFLLIFWMGMMGLVSSQYDFQSKSVIAFFAGALVTVFSTDLLKCLIANRIRKYFLRASIINWINKIIGAVMLIFGIVLLIRAFYNFS